MAEEANALVVVKSGKFPATLIETQVEVTLPAKDLGAVAGAAITNPAISFWPMGSEEIQWVKFRRAQTVMALGAGVLRMAAVTVGLACRRRGPMRELESLTVEGGGETRSGKTEVVHLGMAEPAVFSQLVLCVRDVATQASFRLGQHHGGRFSIS